MLQAISLQGYDRQNNLAFEIGLTLVILCSLCSNQLDLTFIYQLERRHIQHLPDEVIIVKCFPS